MGGAKRAPVMPLEWLVCTPKICLSRPPQRELWEAKGCSECIVGYTEVIQKWGPRTFLNDSPTNNTPTWEAGVPS
jgi:hypothetical protein